MRSVISVILIILLSVPSYAASTGDNDISLIPVVGISSLSGVSSALAQADVALCKSIIFPPHLKGEYGESIVGKFFFEQHLKNSGRWVPVSARLGRQGIDQIYIKYDTKGRPKDIIVGEVKYGSSKLGMTNDDIQMGSKWTSKRLVALGNRYLSISSEKNIQSQKPANKLSIRHEISIELQNGKIVTFWREDGNSAWKFDGEEADFLEAKQKVKSTGKFLVSAGNDVIRIKRRIFEVKIENNHLNIIVKDASALDSGVKQSQIPGQKISVKLDGKSGKISQKALTEEIAKQIQRKFPHLSKKDCTYFAEKITYKVNNPEDLNPVNKQLAHVSTLKMSLRTGLAGAGFVGIFEAISQAINGELNVKKLAGNISLGFLSTAAGNAVGQSVIRSTIQSQIAYDTITRTAESLNVSSSLVRGSLGATAGGGVAALLFSYGGFLLGYYDSYTANKLAVSGVAGTAGGALASAGTLALVSAYGTAGTGVAISSLSGVAASNASLALLGGGTVASGGGGVAMGGFALFGIAGIAAIGFTTAAMYGCTLYEEREDNKLLSLSLKDYVSGYAFENQANNMFNSGH